MKALVTGGGGFLGSALVAALQARGDGVRVLARGTYPALSALGAEAVQGDVRDAEATARACDGVDVVFHTAAKAGGWGDKLEFEAINITGTEHVVQGCRKAGVRALVYTSSPSVVHVPRDIEGDDESLPYATHFLADYPRTKAEGEKRALQASGSGVSAVALRPHFIWGPGDRHLLPRLYSRAMAGRLRQVGPRDPKVDTVYIDNCVQAHLLAADKLLAGAPIGGRSYFVSDGAPIGVWTMANRMLAAAGAPPVKSSVPTWAAYGLGAVLEASYALLGKEEEPMMTRFAASELSHAQWFSIAAARRDLGYAPTVSIDEGLVRLAAWCKAGGLTRA
jgi:nucleoside-diphosphate-sugar epimerase